MYNPLALFYPPDLALHLAMDISSALFTIQQLTVISAYNMDIGLRSIDDEAVEIIAADMRKYGFDPSKSGDFIVSIRSRHVQHLKKYRQQVRGRF